MDSDSQMIGDSSGATPEVSFPVEYQVFSGTDANTFLRGKGTLVVRAGRSRYAFSGRKRRMFSSAQSVDMEFSADDIWNVAVSGRMVRFDASAGPDIHPGEKKPFVFFCRDAETAAAVATLLPDRKDADVVAVGEFVVRLNRLPGATHPWSSVTNLLVAANVMVFVVMAGFLGAGWFDVTNLMPYIRFGANNGGVTTDGEWWRLVTCMFLHYGILHLAMNMWALFQTGHFVEKLFGRILYLAIYFGSGILGSFASLLWNGDRMWSAGASGAVFGVYGALLGYMLREKQALPRNVLQPLFKSTLGFAGYNLLYGLVHPGIDNAAHVGGFVGGLVIGGLIAVPLDAGVRAELIPRRLGLAVAVIALATAVGVIFLPRYDYRLKDELAWMEINKDPVDREKGLLQRLDTALWAYERGERRGELNRLLQDEMIPFYEQWQKNIMAMNLASGKRTDRRRQALGRVFALRIESYRQLLTGIRYQKPTALRDYMRKDREVLDAVIRLSNVK